MTNEGALPGARGGPLEGLRVLEVARDVAGPFAGKLLADYGADVIKIEPPDGDPSRAFGPFPGDEAHPERSGLFLHLNTNKRSIALDASSADGAATIRALAAEADILIEDHRPGEADSWGWGWETLREEHPRLVMASITPFGQDGPYRDLLASELTLQAIGGPLHQAGNRDHHPLKVAGHLAHYHAGLTAAFAALLAYRRVEAGDAGEYIDLSVYECQAGNRDRRTIHLTAASYTGVPPSRASTANRRMGAGIRPCLDGYVNIMGAGRRLPQLLGLIGHEDLADLPGVDAPPALVPPDVFAEVEGAYAEWLATKTKLEATSEAQAAGLLAGAVMTVGGLLDDPFYEERGFWETIDHPEAGSLRYTGRPFVMSASPRPHGQRAPLLDEHAADVDAPWALPRRVEPPSAADPASTGRLPLKGVRVADITVVWAGPHVTQLLAEWGAEVIRVEPVNKVQPYTRGADTAPTKEQVAQLAAAGTQPQYPEMDPGAEPWNRQASFTSHARNKKSMAADVMSPEGREAFLRLIAECDVFVENNVPITIDKAGIGWDELREVNPRLIMLRMPAFALSGERRNYRAFGLHVEAMVGHTHLRCYPDLSPEFIGETLSSDGISGVQGALAVAMALLHRERTGEGQMIEMPLTEGFIPVLGEYVFDYTMNGRDAPSSANEHRWHAPHNVYPTAGDDQWIAIDVRNDEEFEALAQTLGRPELAADGRFATADARREHREALDEAVAALTPAWEKGDLFHTLQSAGVCAAPVNDPLDALADPHLEARGFFEELTSEAVGTYRYPGLTFRMARTPNRLRTPPPRLGEHNEEVYLDLLGYDRAVYEDLQSRGLVGTTYAPSILDRSQPF